MAKEEVTREEFEALNGSVKDMLGLLKQSLARPTAPPTPEQEKEEREIVKASPNKVSVNPEWDEIAKEIIGDAVERTETAYMKGGGLMFTVVIKKDHSNAPLDYLERYREDRRSKEVGSEGEAGVRNWCALIHQNLKRERPAN